MLCPQLQPLPYFIYLIQPNSILARGETWRGLPNIAKLCKAAHKKLYPNVRNRGSFNSKKAKAQVNINESLVGPVDVLHCIEEKEEKVGKTVRSIEQWNHFFIAEGNQSSCMFILTASGYIDDILNIVDKIENISY